MNDEESKKLENEGFYRHTYCDPTTVLQNIIYKNRKLGFIRNGDTPFEKGELETMLENELKHKLPQFSQIRVIKTDEEPAWHLMSIYVKK